MEVRPGYKQTEVGVVPEDWGTASLLVVADCLDNVRVPLNEAERRSMQGDVPYCGANGILDYVNDFVIDDDIILMAEDGGYFDEYASRPIAYRMRGKCWVNNHAHILKAKAGYDQEFLFYSLVHKNILPFLASGTRAKLNKSEMAKIVVPAPPTEAEQRAIAKALSDVDALLMGLDRLIAKKRNIKQAVMQQLLTGQTRLPGFQGEWEVKHLGDVATFHKGRGLPKSSLTPYGAEPCIHYGELFTHYPEDIETICSRTNDSAGAFRSAANDVLMPTSDVTPRGLAKASCVQLDGVILGGDILVIRCDSKLVFGAFLSYTIRHQEAQVLQLVTGTTVFHLYGRDMAKLVLSLPSVEEQIAIVRALTDMASELTALEARRDKTRAVKQGVMQELLTGKTRLVKPEAANV